MIFGIILAGGTGTRMQMENLPKQFLPLGNKPIIIHTLEKFLLCEKFDHIYIGVHPNWLSYMNDLIDTHISVGADKIALVPGGADRSSTLFNCIDDIIKKYGEDESHIVVTHDAVRPFVSYRMLADNIEQCIAYGACDTVVSATDTIVVSTDGVSIDHIPKRSNMYQGQTPQSFNLMKLKRLFDACTAEEKENFTDACGIFAAKGEYVHLVMGDSANLKITTISDYRIAQAMLKEEEK